MKKKVLAVVTAIVLIFVGIAVGSFVTAYQQDTKSQEASHLPPKAPITASAVYEAVNVQRQAARVPQLNYDKKLEASAQSKCSDMASKKYWSHDAPDGSHSWSFIEAQGYRYKAVGENLAFGYETTADTIDGWLKSAGHKENMLNANFSDTGIAACGATDYQGRSRTTIVVQHFGIPK